MKRLIMSLFALCMWGISLHAQSGEFDPANPGDPMPYYALTVNVSPSSGGTANITRTMVAEGQEIALRITPAKDFQLQQWVCGDSVLGTDTYLYYIMPARNVVITAQMTYEPEAFDPPSPDDPQGGDVKRKHLVTVYTSPSVGGSVNRSSFYMQEGAQERIYAYQNAGYEFVGWYVGDRLESSSNPVTLTMYESDVTFTARFRFNPSSPEDPGANRYDAATGTLIIDRFTPGNLSNVVYNLVGNGNYDNIKSVIIKGEMSTDDYGVLKYFNNAEVIDISQTTGYTAIPSWAFNGMTKLSRLLLPATVETIGSEVFYGCSALSEIVIYAPAPPALASYASNPFEGVDNGLVVRVPASSVSLYQVSALWRDFVILPMDVQSLNVSLPEDKAALYENMFLELLDTKSGQFRRYVITPRNQYAFNPVFDGTTYQLTLRNAQNKIFGQEMVTFAGNDTTVSFTSLKQPIDISLHVLDTAGNDVTEHTTIKWYDNENTYASEGKDLSKQLEGDILNYHIQLDASLATTYVEPKDSKYIVNLHNNRIIYALRAMPSVSLIGLVRDSVTKRPVSNASVSVKQIIQGKYNKLFTTETDADGNFVIKVLDVNNTIVTISADNYAKKSFETEQLHDDLHIDLRPFRGVTLNLRLQYSEAVEDTIQAVYRDIYSDYSDFQFVIRNTTQNKWINDYTYNYPLIQIKEDINPSDEIELTVRSANGIFVPYTTSVTINNLHRADAVLQLVESGSISASYVYAPTDVVRAMLFNSAGNLIKNELYGNNSIRFDHLIAGQYTLVSIVNNDRLRSIVRMSDISRFGLQTTDYVQSIVTVSNGYISREQIDSIPNYEELASYLKEGSSFSGNKSSLVVGDYLTLRSQIDFLPQYKNAVSNVELVVVLPQTVQLVENAVMVGSIIGGYNVNGQEISIPIENYNDLVRFCVIPSAEGTFQTSAYVRFISEGKVHNQPLGAASFNVENAKIAAYINYFKDQIIASGMATPYSDIELYDNDELIGAIKANPNGLWQIEADMPYVYNLSKHKVYAKITTPLGISMMTKAKNLLYNISNLSALKTIEMRVYEQGQLHADVIWDYVNAKVTPNSYQYTAAESSFEFIVDFSDSINSQIEGVDLVLYMHDEQRTLPLGYDQTINKWKSSIGKGMIGERGNGIINVGVLIYEDSEVSDDRYLLDAELMSALYAELRRQSSNQLQSDESIYTRLERAALENNEQLVDSILVVLYGERILGNNKELYPEDGDKDVDVDELLVQVDALLDSINAFETEYLFDVDWEKISYVGNCVGLDSLSLLQQGYVQLKKTDGGSVYQLITDSLIAMADFDENIYFTLRIDENMPHSIREMMRIIASNRSCDLPNRLQPLDNRLSEINETLKEITEAWEKIQDKANQQAKMAEAYKEELADKIAKTPWTNRLARSKLVVSLAKAGKEAERLGQVAKNIALEFNDEFKASTMGKVVGKMTAKLNIFTTLVDTYAFLSEETELVHQLNNLFQSVPTPECEEALQRADKLANEICASGSSIAKHTLEGLVYIGAQLTTLTIEIAASPETLGASLLLGLVNVGAGLAFDARKETNQNNDKAMLAKYMAEVSNFKWKCEEDPDPEPEPEPDDRIPTTIIEPIFPDCQAHIDPSGFVYEGVEDNRVEGVKAVVYYKETRENMFGEPVEEDIMWNAWDYDQENPQYTDAEGKYQWFVPQGLWQVRFEKEGYEPTQSEWLPVPPPQLEVNIPIVQLRQPEVINAIAHKDAIDITFDKYMMPSLLNTDNIFVTANDQAIAGTIIMLDEQHPYNDNATSYATKVRFVPAAPFTASEITLTVSTRVHSYADVPLAQTFQQTFDVEDATVIEPAQTPVASIASGTVVELGTQLTLSCTTEGAVIRYTMDGSEPDCNTGYVYSAPIVLYGNGSVTVKAIACADGYDPSEIAQWTYSFTKQEEAIEEVDTHLPQVSKLLRNGQLVIIRDGKTFNALGTEVK